MSTCPIFCLFLLLWQNSRRKYIWKEGLLAFTDGMRSILAGISWRQEQKEAGHIMFSVRKQWWTFRLPLSIFFYSAQDYNPWNVSTYIQSSPLISVKPFQKHPESHAKRCVSGVILDLVKLAAKMNYHKSHDSPSWLPNPTPPLKLLTFYQ